MEEIEVPLEKVQEHIQEAAEHSHQSWILYVALSSAIFAVLAAVTALLSGHHVNEAMINQIKSSNKWGHYQAKSIKSAIVDSRIQILTELGRAISEKEKSKTEEYKKEQEEISREAEEYQKESNQHLTIHETLATSVTLFQISIAVGAISALTRRKLFWHVSLVFGAIGLFFFIKSLI